MDQPVRWRNRLVKQPSHSAQLLRLLREQGLLLQQDKVLPSVVGFVAGEPLASSYWQHPQAHAIFHCLDELADHPDVLLAKLVWGKVTLIHRNLWPALLAVATAGAPWQLAGLSSAARRLWVEVEKQGEVRASGPPAKEVERRLLVHSEQVHTESGRHETRLESWLAWARCVGCASTLSAEEGRGQLEAAVRAIGGRGGELPWEKARSQRGRR
jgi:hypothetical protein